MALAAAAASCSSSSTNAGEGRAFGKTPVKQQWLQFVAAVRRCHSIFTVQNRSFFGCLAPMSKGKKEVVSPLSSSKLQMLLLPFARLSRTKEARERGRRGTAPGTVFASYVCVRTIDLI